MTPHVPPAAPGGESGDEASRQGLSALLDGQPLAGDAQAVQRACALWRESGQARQDWHAWHLIGDVMRSEELARPPSRDAAFLARLRERLADEPVVLAPLPAPALPLAQAAPAAARVGRPAWQLPAALAASFVVLAGVLVVARMAPPPAAAVLVTAPGPGLSVVAVAVPGAAPSSSPTTTSSSATGGAASCISRVSASGASS